MKYIVILLLTGVFSEVRAQEVITIEDAVGIALKNNFGILIAGNEADIAKANNTAGNAGMLPELRINGSGNYSLNNTYQKLSSGNENRYPSQSSTSLNAGTELSWTLFDGGKMFVSKNKLNELQALGEIQYRDKVLETIFSVIAAYYDVVRQKQELNAINEVIDYNKERVLISETGFNAGTMAKTEFLQAKIDLNVFMENAINQQYAIDVSCKDLGVLLGQTSANYDVTDSIPQGYRLDKQMMAQKLDSANTTILAYQKQRDIARLNLKEFQRGYSPTVDFRAGYYLSGSNNSAGSVIQSHTTGPQVGGTISIPIFSSGENKRKTTVAKLDLQSAEYDLQNVKLQVTAELQNTLTGYENQQKLVEIEKENHELARENLEISLQRLRLGQTTSLEVHQAQENYVQSGTRLINFEYNLKIAETKLKQLLANL